MFDKTSGLIIEGTSVLKYLEPDLAILIEKKDLPWKESAKEIFADGRLSKKSNFFIVSDMQELHNALNILTNDRKNAGTVPRTVRLSA